MAPPKNKPVMAAATTSTANLDATIDTAPIDHAAPGSANNEATTEASLAEEKRARKRHLDRISQRRKRQKDRETIDRLKKSLERPDDPTILHSLVLKQEEDLARNYRHNQRMLQIQAIVEADLADTNKSKATGGQPSPPSDDSYDQPQGRISPPQTQMEGDTTHINSLALTQGHHLDLDDFTWGEKEVPMIEPPVTSSEMPEASDMNSYFDMLPILPAEVSNVDLSVFDSSNQYTSLPTDMQSLNRTTGSAIPRTTQDWCCGKCGSIWQGANASIALARQQLRLETYQSSSSHDIDSDAHLMITAIADGWSVAERSPFWTPVWDHLRDLDQLCHSSSGEVERLSILYNVMRMMKYLRGPGGEMADVIPKFLHERPSQVSVPHAVVIDYFVWPGFREHVIFNHQRYCNNDFSDVFSMSVKFLWPYEVRDTYVRNRETNFYQFSRAFLDQADDLRSYTLDMKFFTQYPEFRGEAPMYESVPKICASIHTYEPFWPHFPVSKKQRLMSCKGRRHNQLEHGHDEVVALA